MASNSTPRRFGAALGVVLTGVAAGLIGLTGVASAHTPNIKAYCKGDTTTLKVELVKYDARQANTVKITDGETVLDEAEFKSDYKESFKTSGAVDHTFTVVVKAWDDPKNDKGYSFTKTLKVEKCVTETTTSSSPTSSSPTSSSVPSSSSSAPSSSVPVSSTTVAPTSSSTQVAPVPTSPVTTTTSRAPAPQAAALADTGASIALPLGIAGALLVGGGVLLFIVRKRSRA